MAMPLWLDTKKRHLLKYFWLPRSAENDASAYCGWKAVVQSHADALNDQQVRSTDYHCQPG